MNTGSTASNTMRDDAKTSAKDPREGISEFVKVATAASGDIQKDLHALREDFGRLAEEVTDILAQRGSAAWNRAKSSVDEVVSDTQSAGHDAAETLREVTDKVAEAVDEQLKSRPYTTLAVAAGLGFLFGLTWRR